MKRSDIKPGWTACRLIVICLALSGALALTACSDKADTPVEVQTPAPSDSFDWGGYKIFESYDAVPQEYLTSTSDYRNLADYYSRRQYPGSPPFIPHKVEASFSAKKDNCLSCHEKGGYSAEYGRNAPVTPHPEKESCKQCHIPKRGDKLFAENGWESIRPPRLGRSMLGGSPPPIPHSLQMRDNCIACHTGPGAVAEIRVDHPSRGNCRQCHVPLLQSTPPLVFERKS